MNATRQCLLTGQASCRMVWLSCLTEPYSKGAESEISWVNNAHLKSLIDVGSSDVFIREDGDGGPQGDTHIAVLGSVVQYVGAEVIRGTRVHGRGVAGGGVTGWEATQTWVHALEEEGGRGGVSGELRGTKPRGGDISTIHFTAAEWSLGV